MDHEQPSEKKNTKVTPAYSAPCSECQAGILHLQYITYFTWLNQELITVPNFPAWVCDVCGRREYDPRAINWLNTLLHPETGRHPVLRHKTKPGKKGGTIQSDQRLES
jgi:YgiT-type zinc finger domain-containing protein